MMEVLRYVTESGTDVFGEWLAEWADTRTRANIAARIDRLAAGNFGDCKPLRAGVWELRINWGTGLPRILCHDRTDVRAVAVRRRQAEANGRH
jgi:putative addiction module killer protein